MLLARNNIGPGVRKRLTFLLKYMRAKIQNCSTPRAEQKELPFFLAKSGKVGISNSEWCLTTVGIKQNTLETFMRTLENHKSIRGLAMVALLPFLLIAGFSNIHNPLIVIPILIIIAGLYCPKVASLLWPPNWFLKRAEGCKPP